MIQTNFDASGSRAATITFNGCPGVNSRGEQATLTGDFTVLDTCEIWWAADPSHTSSLMPSAAFRLAATELGDDWSADQCVYVTWTTASRDGTLRPSSDFQPHRTHNA